MTTILKNKIAEAMIASKELEEAMLLLKELTEKYDSVSFDDRLNSIVDNAKEISHQGLLPLAEKDIGELFINYILCGNEWFQDYGLENYEVIERLNSFQHLGDAIKHYKNHGRPSVDDRLAFNNKIIQEFGLFDQVLENRENYFSQHELAYFANSKLNNDFNLFEIEIIETGEYYCTCPECEESGDCTLCDDSQPMFEGNVLYNEEVLFTSGRYCEIADIYEELVGYLRGRMGNFLESLGFTPSDITDLVINGDKAQRALALQRAKSPIAIKLRGAEAQEILDLFHSSKEGSLWHSESSCTHDPDLQRVFLEISPVYKTEGEFQGSYEELERILENTHLSPFIIIDY